MAPSTDSSLTLTRVVKLLMFSTHILALWKLPILVVKFGGAAFLLVYLLVNVFVVWPIEYLVMCVGQFTGRGQYGAIRTLAPFGRWLGIVIAFNSYQVASFFQFVLALSIHYMANLNGLPWTTCGQWAMDNCVGNGTTVPDPRSTVIQYYNGFVTQSTLGFSIIPGSPSWQMTVCLFAAAVLVSFGVWFLSLKLHFELILTTVLGIVPYVFFIILMTAALAMPGGAEGVRFMFTANWVQMANMQSWYEAFVLAIILYRLGPLAGPAVGSQVPFASYRLNIDFVITIFGSILYHLLSCMAVFSVLGVLAAATSRSVSNVMMAGPALAFQALPDAASRFPSPGFISWIVFMIPFTLMWGTCALIMSGILKEATHSWPNVSQLQKCVGLAVVFGVTSLLYATPSAPAVFDVIVYYCTLAMIILNAFYCAFFVWVFGGFRLSRSIAWMQQGTSPIWWRLRAVHWMLLPLISLSLVLWGIIKSPLVIGEYPHWIVSLGQAIVGIEGILLVGFLALALWRADGDTMVNKLKAMFTISPYFGPHEESERFEWQAQEQQWQAEHKQWLSVSEVKNWWFDRLLH